MNAVEPGVAVGTARQLGGKYLTFPLGEGSYGIEVARVREIMRYGAITVVPKQDTLAARRGLRALPIGGSFSGQSSCAPKLALHKA